MAAMLGWLRRGEHLGFAGEAGEAVGVGGEGVGEDFDGDVAIELGVGGAVDGAHAAFAEFGGDAVVGDGGGRAHCAGLASYHARTAGRTGARFAPGAARPGQGRLRGYFGGRRAVRLNYGRHYSCVE